jgi:GTP cyclohydrolase IA
VSGNSGFQPADEIDHDLAADAAAQFIKALGIELDPEAASETPRRMARAYAELLTPRPFEATVFPNDGRYRHLVLARRIPFQSLCEHHLLPFTGFADVGYLPADHIVGLSKLARLVEACAMRPQVQERLTEQIADWLERNLDARGAGVVLRAEHQCMTLRGVRTAGVETVTVALRGAVEHDREIRREFFDLTAG